MKNKMRAERGASLPNYCVDCEFCEVGLGFQRRSKGKTRLRTFLQINCNKKETSKVVDDVRNIQPTSCIDFTKWTGDEIISIDENPEADK